MTRLTSIDPAAATGKAKTLLDGVKGKLGMVPNMARAMATSPAVLEGYLGFAGALAGGALDAKTRERIALAVGEANACGYCLAAHSLMGKGAGLDAAAILAARHGTAADPRVAEAVGFALRLVRNDGHATDADLARLRAVGWNDGEIAEMVANVALNMFTNWFNHVAATDIDFPVAPALAA